MKFEVIDISTTTETYIANNILTHNKASCTGAPSPGSPTYNNVGYGISFGSGYSPSYPIVLYTTIISSINQPGGCKSAAAPGPITITNASQLNGSLNIAVYNNPYEKIFSYTASIQGVDSSGKYSKPDTPAQYKGRSNACLTPDTLISKYDGIDVYLKDINIGDELLTIDPKTLEYKKSIVTDKRIKSSNKLYLINNDLLKCTDSHIHIIKRGGDWIEENSENLIIGDVLLNKSFEEIKITKIDIIK